MDSSELSDVAWDLVEHGRESLTIAELNAVFVRLGIGDYSDAIEIVLKSIVRAAGPYLPDQLVERLTRLGQEQYFNPGFADLLEGCRATGRPAQ